MVSLDSKCTLGQEHLEEFRNVFDFKKADFGRMWYAPRNFYWNPMKHGKHRAEFLKNIWRDWNLKPSRLIPRRKKGNWGQTQLSKNAKFSISDTHRTWEGQFSISDTHRTLYIYKYISHKYIFIYFIYISTRKSWEKNCLRHITRGRS